MPSEKYPDSGRRRFVKGVVGSAGLAGVGTAGTAAVNSLVSSTGVGGGAVTYYGIENTDGPAPRAMPQIPVELDDDGYLKGKWTGFEEVEAKDGGTKRIANAEEIAGVDYSPRWFQYCGIQGVAGLQPDYDGDNYFRYAGGGRAYDWQPSDGRVNVEDFADYETWTNGVGKDGLGKGAFTTWRSQNVDTTIPVQIIRSTRIEAAANGDGEAADWLAESTAEGFMAVLNKCTHYCCTPKFKSPQGVKFDAENGVYCPCHQSSYDPFSIVKRSYTALPRPGD
ncbi:Rieske (2Fe-2S) protein [Halobacterium litoreum]|uniref:Rieske 2Fe-2S domain-containing protein n=1 Tax=Halobacterium litoreum TaxID=2039234 RepID=A0ABD5NFC4_9EURY|nr:Rieske 2Fe-2S domain-containing protein [Halobacterium litoreum]UHH13363.1 Rieske 2Fe-2S domain-containing protein [Halobacterium litoreum]